jgi:ADP-heptose:LPS heptosyltransferase
MKGCAKKRAALRYRLDRSIRGLVMKAMNRLTPDYRKQEVDFQPQKIKKILIVRSLFRMGDAILATPAILLFRRNFPAAKIDFVGPPITKSLFENLPIDRHYVICKSFPRAGWSYLLLLKQIRETQYDLAFDASGSSAALSSFIIGFSAARLRVGLRGKWDRWFNVRLDRPATKNKYRTLPELIGSLGLESRLVYPRLFLSPAEVAEGRSRLQVLTGRAEGPIIGVFTGGRKTRGKRWDKENFLNLAKRLRGAGAQPVIFVGPEEKDLLPYFEREMGPSAPAIFEPNVRLFASLVANCNLFVACDSGPVHLACALRIRTIAIFLTGDVNRWGPPDDLGRIVRCEEAASVDAVFKTCHQELLESSRKSSDQQARTLEIDSYEYEHD